MNIIQKGLLVLYVVTVWIAVLFFTPYRTTAHSGGASLNLMEFHPIWGGDKTFKILSRIDYGFIGIEIVMISILFISLVFMFQGKTKRKEKTQPTHSLDSE